MLCLVGYGALGFGLVGGWPHWNGLGRAVYCLAFPVHAVLTSMFRDFSAAMGDERMKVVYWIIVIIVIILLSII